MAGTEGTVTDDSHDDDLLRIELDKCTVNSARADFVRQTMKITIEVALSTEVLRSGRVLSLMAHDATPVLLRLDEQQRSMIELRQLR